MNPLQLAQTRYATKKYDVNKEIDSEKIEQLKEVLRLTPSSINIQPWQFSFVQDPQIKAQLAAASLHNEEKINQAKLLVVFSFADDLEMFQKVVDTALSAGHRDWYNSSKETMSDQEIKNWFTRQVYIALGFGLSAAASLGLDSTPMEGIEPDKYIDILKIDGYRPVVAMAVGYGASDDRNRPEVNPKSRRNFDDVIHSF